ncbi:MAG: alkaline phosphatase D family protein [Aphanocapsa sp. GSE-SYN-MK-11-07L]|jgi:alkaline phosphatase D|nr:alkaline phosphatase D family protein [Aphanocapsa sp. GSE-SYN-MK-11-07L]
MVKRRNLLLGAGATLVGVVGVQGQLQSVAQFAQLQLNDYPFKLGVASGDPQSDSVVIWTRLVGNPLSDRPFASGSVPVQWQVATDQSMRQVVARGTALATPDFAHAVHVVVNGLNPNQWYWYQFKVGNAANSEVSPEGRTKTAPAQRSALAPIRFAFASCQNYEHGYFNAYRHMAAEDLDFVLHLGDYIYEGGGIPLPNLTRLHNGPEPTDLAGYRRRYAQYKLDPDLQTAHRLFPFICTWDDHEVDNDYANAQSQDFATVTDFLNRRAAAYQAYYEHLPLRPESKPTGSSLQLYRHFQFGELIQIQVLDTRQYRDDQPCANGKGGGQIVKNCQERLDPQRSLLGSQQEAWLLNGLTTSKAGWNVIAQPYLVAELRQAVDAQENFWSDGWDGYAATRQRLLNAIAERKPANPIFLGGDIHSFWVTDLKADFRNPTSPILASEFVGTSISSNGIPYELVSAVLPSNLHIKFFESRLRGYVRCTVTGDRWLSELRAVDTVKQKQSSIRTLAAFAVEAGQPGAQKG